MTNTPQKGFTLVETLVAIAILMIAMAGPFASLEQSILAAHMAQDKMTATYLAQEGVEFVRALRDKEYIQYCYHSGGSGCDSSSSFWWWRALTTNQYGQTTNVESCSTSGFGCAFDGSPGISTYSASFSGPVSSSPGRALTICTGDPACGQLYLTPGGQYTTTYASGDTKTPFIRTVTAAPVSATEMLVQSVVKWTEHGTTQSVKATDHLTAWE